MRLKSALGSLLLMWATGAAADGFSSLNAELRFNPGDVSRNGTVSSFKDDILAFAYGVYDLGEWTVFGGIETQRTDFSANGGAPNDQDNTLYVDLGGERSFGAFGFGGQLAYLDFGNDNFGVDTSATFVSAYGQYEMGGLVAGAGLFYSNESNPGMARNGEMGVLAFVSNDFSNGLTVGAQVAAQSDGELVELYADYAFNKGDVSFSLINTSGAQSVVQFVSLEGRYQIYNQFNAIAEILNSDDPSGDSTTELAMGIEYDFGNGAAVNFQYVEYSAFNGFIGDGISFGLTYQIGKMRKSGYQPIGKTFAEKNSAVFFTY